MTPEERIAWLDRRRRGIGGSDAPAIWSDDPRVIVPGGKDQFDLWGDKCGFFGHDPDNPRMEWGRRLESVICDALQDALGTPIRRQEGESAMVFGEFPMFATLDGTLTDPETGEPAHAEIKTVAVDQMHKWERGNPPMSVQIQVQHQLACYGTNVAYVACLIGGNEFRFTRLERQERFIRAHIERCREFWNCVTTRNPPPVTERTSRISDVWPNHTEGVTVELSNDIAEMDLEYEELLQRNSEITSRMDLIKNRIRVAIGLAERGILPSGTVWTYKRNSAGARALRRKARN